MSLKGVGILIASVVALLSAHPARGAQQAGKMPRVGIVWTATPATVAPFHEAFRQGLRDLGYVEGETIALETRFAEGMVDRLPALMAELVGLKADVIVAPSTPAVRAARRATGSIPIVMGNVADPVGLGFVSSLAQPGGNITGLSNLTVELAAKTMELLKDLLPRLSRASVLLNPAHPDAEPFARGAKAAANTLRRNCRSSKSRILAGSSGRSPRRGSTARARSLWEPPRNSSASTEGGSSISRSGIDSPPRSLAPLPISRRPAP